MKRGVTWPLLILSLAASGLLGAERAIESFLPADAFLAATYDGGHPGFRQTPLYRFFQEPEVAAALKQFQPLFDKIADEAAKEGGVDLRAIARMAFTTRWAVALTRGAAEKGEPAVVVAWHVGAEGGATRAAADALRESLLGAGKPDTAQDVEIAGFRLTAQQDKTGDPMLFGFAGQFFVLGNDKAALTRALDPAAPKLKLPAAAERAVFRVRYDHPAMEKAFAAQLAEDPQAKKVLDGLGISGIRSLEFALVPRGKRLVTQFQIELRDGAERVGLAKWLTDSPPVDRELLKMVPRDAMLFYATSLDLGGLWDEVWATIERIDPDAAAEARQGLAQLEQRLGLKVRDGLLKPLERGTVVLSQGGGWLGGGAIVVQRTGAPEALEAAIVQVVNRLDLVLAGAGVGRIRMGAVRTQLKPFTYRGHRCHYLWLMGMPAVLIPGSAPCYARLGKTFIFAQHPLHLKSYLDFITDKGPSVLDNPDFRALQGVIPEKACLISFAAWPDTIVSLYNTLGPFLMLMQGIPDMPAALDVANMPSSRLLRRYSRGAVLYSVFENGRYRVELQGDGLDYLSPQAAPLGAVAVLAGMLLPALTSARTEARRIRDRNNLNQIAKGMATYLNEHGDNRFYPASLGELWDKKVIPDPGVFISPLDRAPPKLPNGLACSYVSCFDKYPKRQFLDDFPPNVAMAWNRISFPGQGGGRSVVFMDSHVEWVDEARFQELMKQLDEEVKRNTRPRGAKRPAGGRL